jgi:hypothetical protein
MHAVVFPLPTGPAASRKKAFDLINLDSVGGAVYSIDMLCCI